MTSFRKLFSILLIQGLPELAKGSAIGDAFEDQSANMHSQNTQMDERQTKISVSSVFEIPTYSFLISTAGGRVDRQRVDQRVQYNPTFGPNIGVSIGYNSWSLRLTKKLSFIDEKAAKTYGKSDYDDFRVSYSFLKDILIESYYQNYLGFYTDPSSQEGLQTTYGIDASPGSTSSQLPQSQIIKRSDISALNYGLRANYTIPLMPFFALFEPADQSSSNSFAFNFLAKLYYNHTKISGNQPLVPPASSSSLSSIANLTAFSTYTVGLGAGMEVIVPLSPKFQMGFNVTQGSGLQRQTRDFLGYENRAFTKANELSSNLNIDWNGKDHGIGFNVYFDSQNSSVEDINFDTSNVGLSFIYSFKRI